MSLQLRVAAPPQPYGLPALLVDARVLAGMVFREAWYEQARQHIEDRHLHAPHLILHEISSVALKKWRRQEAHALDGLALALQQRMDLHTVDPMPAFALAQQYQLSAYDAAYLHLATQLHCPLATFDDALDRAARLHWAQLGGQPP